MTQTGDDGSTGLFFNRRVPKNHPQVEAYGALDELNAALGCCRVAGPPARMAEQILQIQKEMVIVMGELSVLPEDRARYAEKGHTFVTDDMVERVAAWASAIEKQGVRYDGWATPGGTPLSAQLDMARVTCRRAERRVASLGDAFLRLNPSLLRYLNRLSDLFWLYARESESKA